MPKCVRRPSASAEALNVMAHPTTISLSCIRPSFASISRGIFRKFFFMFPLCFPKCENTNVAKLPLVNARA